MTITYSGDVVAEPKHLDYDFFTDILENALLRNNFQIKTIDFTMGSSTGENYCSQIYRVTVSYKSTNDNGNDGCISVIIKSMPHTEATDFLLDLNVFLKERIFYNNVLPRLEVLCKDDVKFAPRLYHSLKTPVNTLVFEDLAVGKFEMASREKGLDLAHSLMVMNKLGKFHAASVKLFKKVPELQQCFNSGMLADTALNKDEGMVMKFFGNNIKALIDLIETWQGYEKITEKLRNYSKNLRNNLRRSGAAEKNGFCVLNHGDLWVNNILFKYNDQRKLVDLNFVDFQMSVWNTPGIDLNYFFYTSIEFDILQNKLDVLIKEYHGSLSEGMQELGIKDIPSYQDIYNEVQKRQLYGFFAHYGVFPVICQDKEQSHDSNLENFNDEAFAKQKLKQIFASKRLQAFYRYTLENFDKMGIFDYISTMEIVYDKTVVVIPKHLNLDFFEEIVENAVQEANPLIKRIFIKMGSSAGDNYCSLIYRVLISYTLSDNSGLEHTISVIIKSMPVTKSIDFLEDMKVFLKEKIFYYHVLPIMEIFTNDRKQFGAKLYQCLKRPINTLVFQDLGSLGYGLASRERGMDENHASLVLKRLAQFHSISLVVKQKDPSLFKCFNSGILAKGAIQRDNSTFYCLIKASCEALIDLAKTWKGYEDICRKLENHLKNLRSKLEQMQKPQEQEFQVLNHGDMWVNNMMFRYDNVNCQQPQDVVFVDFQMSIWGSPGIDLNYFFYTSLPVKLLKEKREHFIELYYEELQSSLKKLNYEKIPTLQQIRNEVRKRELFGFFANHAIYPIISIDKEIAADSTFENFADREFAKKKFKQILEQQKLKDMYAYTLLHFNEMKVFD
ncbi:uncharacterized protein LOC111690962 [Lucilia cuprina]|uniref:uncharacterized protein LOC111690962 n=1 Tax=Lucilia cuprina TaxID=7375 RepID=UPI001F05760E|nr:uncharacterized protein LOC111690962 [Lucilia cuprina]